MYSNSPVWGGQLAGAKNTCGSLDLEDEVSDLGENLFQNTDFFFSCYSYTSRVS